MLWVGRKLSTLKRACFSGRSLPFCKKPISLNFFMMKYKISDKTFLDWEGIYRVHAPDLLYWEGCLAKVHFLWSLSALSLMTYGPARIPAVTVCYDPSHLAAKLSPQVEQRHKTFKQQLLKVRIFKSTFFSLRFCISIKTGFFLIHR